MNYPKTIKDLIECFKKLPGIGEKTAERLALSTLEIDNEVLDLFSESLKNVKNKIKRCNIICRTTNICVFYPMSRYFLK